MFTPDKPKNYFLSQVHQPFFLSGVVAAIVVMLMFMLAYKGIVVLEVDSVKFHSYSLIYLVFTQFFTGFIFTTFPRFCQSEVVTKAYYLLTWGLQQSGMILFLFGAVFSLELLYAGFAVLLLANAAVVYKLALIYRQAPAAARHDPKWILVGFGMGIVAHFLYLLDFAGLDDSAVDIALNLYLVYVTFAVGQRMVPFFSHSLAAKNDYFLPIVFSALVVKTVASVAGLPVVNIITDIGLGLYIVLEVKRWKMPFRGSPAILKILHVSFYWLITAFLAGGVIQLIETVTQLRFMALETHLLAIGFVTTMLVGFGTRVTLGHSGQPPHADATTLRIFYLLLLVVLGRVLFSLLMGLNTQMFWSFDVSVTLWLLLFILWGVRFGPVLISGRRL